MSEGTSDGHAFISYVHENAELVDALEAFLEASGIRVWRDRNELWPGEDWKIEIRRAIQRNALAFIACFSDESIAKERSYQNEELALAVEEYRLRRPGRPWLFPVRFSDVELPPYELGAGKTLDALQRTDLFGATREPNLGRLAVGIGRVIYGGSGGAPASGTPSQARNEMPATGEPPTASTALTPQVMKALLRDPTKDIQLDDAMTALGDQIRQACLDPVQFPTTSDELRRGNPVAARFVSERCDEYWRLMTPLCEALLVGCAWGKEEHLALWTRVMRVIANITPTEGGQQILLDLRAYPRVMALYAAAIGAVAREKYDALRAVTVEPKYRRDGQSVPVVGVCNAWIPFSSVEWIASVVAREADGQPATDEEIEGFARRSGGRKTPVSDDLHTRLREVSRPLLPDDEEYDEVFDRVELLLGLIAQDAAAVEKAAGRYTLGGWVGRYVWRNQSMVKDLDRLKAEIGGAGTAWAPLRANLFGGSMDRVLAAVEGLRPQVESHRFW